MVILQLAAIITRIQGLPAHVKATHFPNGVPAFPVLLCLTDNVSSLSWCNRVTSKSPQGQALLEYFAELLRVHDVGINAKHIPGVDNDTADFLSRPTNSNAPPSTRVEQIFQKHSWMQSYDFFQPHPMLVRDLSSRLCSVSSLGRPKIPKILGQFEPAASISSSFATI